METHQAHNLPAKLAKHAFRLSAAVKAIAFCPFQRGLLALGGGSNDRRIHFHHTVSGATLAQIDCAAQVTSLLWSETRREIAVTLGFAQPEHPVRIAVFTWPSCECVVRIAWKEEHRALFAVKYPGGPEGLINEHSARSVHPTSETRNSTPRRPNTRRDRPTGSNSEGGSWLSRTRAEGCIVVATSDASIKFHEVWADEARSLGEKSGLLGGSAILEGLHGLVGGGLGGEEEVIR